MPLAHAILGFLEYQSMTGYDLKKFFDQSVAHFWSATQSHIYKALENLEKEGFVESSVIPQEGKPNRKQYQITVKGRGELRQWVSTPMPLEVTREAWLIQIFFAHGIKNEEIVQLFEKRIEAIREYLKQCQIAQAHIDENYEQVGIERMRELWQLTLDYGTDYYENEIAWLEKTLPRIRELPTLGIPKK
ncbi:MAG: PadR family transcriptional regulator [Chloroflexi bacterium]|nr:PadR family transcriptional regulator [Chloroflexota bacterium]